jgi:hypothetical protein
MIAPGNQILDLLLGNVSTGEQPAMPITADQADAAGFGDILSTLLSLGGQPINEGAADGMGLLSGQIATQDLSALLSHPTDASGIAMVVPNTPNVMTIMSGPGGVADNAGEAEAQILPMAGDGLPTASASASAWTTMVALPAQGPISNQFLRDIINNVTTSLQPGLYQITSASIANGKLNLTLADPLGGAEPIKVLLPAEPMQQAIGQALRQPLLPQRVELGEGIGGSPRLEALLSDLHLKELVVEKPAPANIPAQAVDAPVLSQTTAITITAEHAGTEVAIRAKLSRSSMKVSGASEEMSDDAAEPVAQSEGETSDPAARVRLAKSTETSDMTRLARARSGRDGMDGEKTLAGLGKQSVEGGKAMISAEVARHNADTAVSSDKADPRPVRISLPENIASALKPNGRSVMLKIEPQQLGPARLTLVMNNDTLSARLVVESTAAKAAVERHLDGLVDRLAKADINVGSIEVEVSGGGAQDGSLDRRTFWSSHRTFPAHSLTEDNSNTAKTAATPALYAAPAMYAGAGGVNILA